MSTIVVTNISDGTKSVPSTAVTEGAPIARFNYNQITPVLNGSYNITSITDLATGRGIGNPTNTLADTDYTITTVSASAAPTNLQSNPRTAGITVTGALQTSQWEVYTHSISATTNATGDAQTFGLVSGDLA